MKPHSPILLIVAIVLFVISALISTGGGFRSPIPPGQPSGPWGWGNWIFGWAMVFFAASFYPF
jgi:hypothetical protein